MDSKVGTSSKLLLRSATNAFCSIFTPDCHDGDDEKIVTSWSWSIVTSGRDQYDENQQAAYFDKLCREPAPRVSSPVSPLQNTKSTRNSFRKAIPHPVPWHGIAGSPSPTKWERMQEKMRWSIKSKSDLLPTCSGGRGRKRTPPPSLLSRCWSKQACQKKC